MNDGTALHMHATPWKRLDILLVNQKLLRSSRMLPAFRIHHAFCPAIVLMQVEAFVAQSAPSNGEFARQQTIAQHDTGCLLTRHGAYLQVINAVIHAFTEPLEELALCLHQQSIGPCDDGRPRDHSISFESYCAWQLQAGM